MHLIEIRIILISSHPRNQPAGYTYKENMATSRINMDPPNTTTKIFVHGKESYERKQNSNCITVVASLFYQTPTLDTPEAPLNLCLLFHNSHVSNPSHTIFHIAHDFYSHHHYSFYALVSQLIYSKYSHIFFIYLFSKDGLNIH